MANPSDQRATKADRKEQARREREELQRRAAASKRNRRIATGVVIVLAAGVTAFVLSRPEPAKADPNELLRTAEQAKQDAGCAEPTNVGAYQPRSEDQLHVPTEEMPALSTYPSVPASSGPHNEIPLPAGVYATPPPIDRLIHSLEHGAAVVWYAPGTTGAALDELTAFFEDDAVGSRVIVAPYDYPDQGAAGSLPQGVGMSIVAWHHVQECTQVSVAAAFDFTSSYAAPPFGDRSYLGEAPEAGALF